MNIQEIDKWLKDKYGVSYTRLEELHDFVVEQDLKHREEKDKEIERLHSIIKEAREYIESYNLPKDLGHLGEAPISIRELRDILEILDKVEENK